MITRKAERLVTGYFDYLRGDAEVEEVNGYLKFTTPFIDRNNDFIQVYAQKEKEGRWHLTDDGYTIRDLRMSGCDVSSEKRSQLLQTVLNRLAVEKSGDELVVVAEADEFAQAKHSLVQAILSVGDLFYTSQATVMGLFMEEVSSWLNESGVRYVDNVKFSGRSGFDYSFDFVIPRSDKEPERVLQALNRPDRARIMQFMLAWEDTKSMRRADSAAFAILNDEEVSVSDGNLRALRNYNINPLLWSERDHMVERMVA